MELLIDNLLIYNSKKVGRMKKIKFIGREKELLRLENEREKKVASFIVLKGRRRIGKSRLAKEFAKNFDAYYKFEGLAPAQNVQPIDQLEEFCNQISREFNAPKAMYNDWSDAFWAVGERVQKGRVLLFFDELSWMGNDSPTFLPKIKLFWDNLLSNNINLVFIVCSSASSWIEKNLLSSTAFVGRVSMTMTLNPLPLSDCSKFWGKNISAYEQLKVLCVTGGIPRYLEEINPRLSAEENVKQLCFTKGGLLVKEFERIFSDLFMRESKFYEKIVEALAGGAKEQVQIQREIGSEESQYGRLPEYLWELEEAGFIVRDYTWNLDKGTEGRLSKYRLGDNYLRFYLKYIKKNLSRIERDGYSFKTLSNLPEWLTIMGFQFEALVLNNRKKLYEALNLNPVDIINENPFFQNKTNRLKGCQIDYLIQTKFKTLYVVEIKFHQQLIGVEIIDEVQQKIDRISVPSGYSFRPVLVHVNGVTDDLSSTDYFSAIVDVKSYLSPDP